MRESGSFGDAWAPRYEERQEGFSLLAVRTPRGETLFDSCLEAGVIQREASDLEDALAMHSHGLYNKKYAVWSRIALRRWMGKPTPDYGYTARCTPRQQGVGLLLAVVFWTGRTALARGAVQLLPLELTGRAFLFVRKRWRNATRPRRKEQVKHYDVHWK